MARTLVAVTQSGKRYYKDDTAAYSNISISSDTGGYQLVGFTDVGGVYEKAPLSMSIFVPDNFEIINAYIEFRHSPRHITNLPNNFVGDPPLTTEWCYCRNIKPYINTSLQDYQAGIYGSSWTNNPNLTYTEIIGGFGVNGFTATPPAVPPASNPQNVVQMVESIDIKSYIEAGKYTNILLNTTDAIPNYSTQWKLGYTKTANCKATIVVIGYIKRK